MYKLWHFLGLGFLVLAMAGYIDQVERCHESWDWSQFLHHEALIVIAAVLGIALLVVSLVEYMRG